MDNESEQRLDECRAHFNKERRNALALRERLSAASLLVWNRGQQQSFKGHSAVKHGAAETGETWLVDEKYVDQSKGPRDVRKHVVRIEASDTKKGASRETMIAGSGHWWETVLDKILDKFTEPIDEGMEMIKLLKEHIDRDGGKSYSFTAWEGQWYEVEVKEVSKSEKPVFPWQDQEIWSKMDSLADAQAYTFCVKKGGTNPTLELTARRTYLERVSERYVMEEYSDQDLWEEKHREHGTFPENRRYARPKSLQWEDILLRMKQLWEERASKGGHGQGEAGASKGVQRSKRLGAVHDVGIYRTPNATKSYWDFTVDGTRHRVVHCTQWPHDAGAALSATNAQQARAPCTERTRVEGWGPSSSHHAWPSMVRAPTARPTVSNKPENPWLGGFHYTTNADGEGIKIKESHDPSNAPLAPATACRFKSPHIPLLSRICSSRGPLSLSSTHRALRILSGTDDGRGAELRACQDQGGLLAKDRVAVRGGAESGPKDACTMVQLVCKNIFEEEFKTIPGYNHCKGW